MGDGLADERLGLGLRHLASIGCRAEASQRNPNDLEAELTRSLSPD